MSQDLLRWRDYFLREGEHFEKFWQPFLNERKRNVLFVLGHGFDARMCEGIEKMLSLGGEGARDVALLAFHEGSDSHSNSYAHQRKLNGERLEKLVQGRGKIGHRTITMFSEEGRRIGPLGGCKVALSAMSSKLASIGVLLAAYELGRRNPRVIVGVAHVESQGYRVEQVTGPRPAPTLFTMWLSGECYAA